MDRGRGDWRKDLEEKARKQHEIMFEACKHFTTLNTAVVLIVVAIFRELGSVSLASGPLILFAFSLFLCGYGMITTALGGLGNTKVATSTGFTLVVGALAFFIALLLTAGQILLST